MIPGIPDKVFRLSASFHRISRGDRFTNLHVFLDCFSYQLRFNMKYAGHLYSITRFAIPLRSGRSGRFPAILCIGTFANIVVGLFQPREAICKLAHLLQSPGALRVRKPSSLDAHDMSPPCLPRLKCQMLPNTRARACVQPGVAPKDRIISLKGERLTSYSCPSSSRDIPDAKRDACEPTLPEADGIV